MANATIREKLNALNRATESFRETKRKNIRKICSVGIRYKWLKFPMLIVAFFYILFVNALFYISLWTLLHKRAAIGLMISMVAAVGVCVVLSDYVRTNNSYDYVATTYAVKDTDDFKEVYYYGIEDLMRDAAPSQEKTDIKWIPWSDAISVDFDSLKAINEDVVGWLFFENEDISYPIMQGNDNEKYMSVTYDGEQSRSGSIFLECENNPDFDDFHTIIYGHNMRNLSMFGKLRYYYQKEDYIRDHTYFQIITPKMIYRYRIVSYKHVAANDSIYRVKGLDGENGIDFVKEVMTDNSMLNMTFDASDSDRFVTLSTCSYEDNRFVVSAIRVDETVNVN